jgi:hypothetical protein
MRAFFASLILTMALGSSALACSCAWPDENETPAERASRYDAIFEGKFLGKIASEKRPDARHVQGRFRVVEALKGVQTRTVELHYIEGNGANCGVKFMRGETYYIFARGTERGLSTSLCDGLDHFPWEDYRSALRG